MKNVSLEAAVKAVNDEPEYDDQGVWGRLAMRRCFERASKDVDSFHAFMVESVQLTKAGIIQRLNEVAK